MFGPPRTAGQFVPTARGPIRIYGTAPSPVVASLPPIPPRTVVRIALSSQGVVTLVGGPALTLTPGRPPSIVPTLYAVLAPGYRGPVRVNSPAPIPRVTVVLASPFFTGPRYDTTSGYVYAFPPKHPFGPVYPDYERWLLPVTPRKLLLRGTTDFTLPGL